MEIVDNAIILILPGQRTPANADALFWASLAFALAVAFVVILSSLLISHLTRAGPRRRPRTSRLSQPCWTPVAAVPIAGGAAPYEPRSTVATTTA